MQEDSRSNRGPGLQSRHLLSKREREAAQVNCFKAHPFQKDNPALRQAGFKLEFDANLHVDLLVKGLELGVMYLDASFHISNQTQLEKRLEYCAQGSKEQSGVRQFLAYMMDHKESHKYVCGITLLCAEFNTQLLLLKGQDDFRNFLVGLNRQALPLLQKSSIAFAKPDSNQL